MRNCLQLAATLVIVAGCGSARQPLPELVSDRPDATESAVSVPAGRVQVEAGYTYTHLGAARVHTVGEVLTRVGLGEGLELRLGMSSVAVEMSPAEPTRSGLEDTSLGAKMELPSTRLFPETAVLVGTSVPTGSSGFGEGAWRPSVLVSAAWSLVPGIDGGVNAGWASNGNDGELVGSAAVGFPVSERLGAFVETFGSAEPGGVHRGFVDGGLTFAWTRDLQLDLRAGAEVGGAGERFIGAGLVRRW